MLLYWVHQFSSVQFSCSVISDSLRPHELQHARPPCPSHSPPKPMSIELVMPSNHLTLCCPLLLLLSIFPRIRVFSNESALCIKWPKYWEFQLQHQFSSVQSLSRVRLFVTPWSSTPRLPVHHQLLNLLKLMSIESMMPANHLILCCRLLLLPSIFPRIRVFLNESVLCIRWSKYWSFSFRISPSNEYSGLISFRMDWLDLLAVQGTLKSLLQYHSSKALILQCSAFFMVQLTIHTWWLEKPYHSFD